jgi:Tfp pilus assembly protein PilV
VRCEPLGALTQPVRARLRRDDGFTLFEVLIAAVVLVVGLTTLFGLLDTSVKASAATRAREGATSLARETVEDARTVPYAQLSPTSVVEELQKLNGLANSTPGNGWHIVRRGVTYTVVAEECAIDDPKDGYGEHKTPSLFCADSTQQTIPAADTQPEDLKRITVTVTWTAKGRTPSVKEVQTLTAAGQAVGLSATNLQLISPSGTQFPSGVLIEAKKPIITNKTTETLTFSFSAPSTATATSWALEGSGQTPAPALKSGSTEEWTFSWTISSPAQNIYVSDGTYLVSAQAINPTGVVGPPISIPVTLIRGEPAAPTGLVGGFNTVYVNGVENKAAEVQWQANTERNVIGYRVKSGGLVCPGSEATLSLAVSCIAFSIPGTVTERTYSVTALYRNSAGEVKEGPASSVTVTRAGSVAPSPIAELKIVERNEENGSVTLKWPSSAGASFYRIYRGSKNYTSRYDVTTSTSYVDTHAVANGEYWVTAVSPNLTESAAVGPVS